MRPVLSGEIVARAESYAGIKVGMACLEDVLRAPSHEDVLDELQASPIATDVGVTEWPSEAPAVLMLGLHHPGDDPRLDYWDEGGSPGDRRLVAICNALTRSLGTEYGVAVRPLTYQPERGGVFLKDAAALAGLGVIGRNNLLINPEWGPRIRFRALLLEADLEPTGPLEGFSPCDECPLFCHRACPRDAFSTGVYERPPCADQMLEDVENASPEEGMGDDGGLGVVIKYCRACELSCPVGR